LKKSLKIFLVIIIILIVVVAGIALFTYFDQNKKPLTANEFSSIMENHNYIVSDVADQISEYDYVTSSYIASNNEFQIEFYVFSNDDYALNFYTINKNNFGDYEDNTSTTTEVNLGNCSRYSLTTISNYMYVSRIGNTVIYIDTPIMYQNNVKSILDELGY